MRMKMKNKIAGAAAFMLSAFLLSAVTAYAEETTAVSTDVSTVTGSGIEKNVMTINPTELPDTEITPESVTDDISDLEQKFPSGNGHLLEDVLDGNVNRQFLTIQSRNGNTFYIVVDKDDSGHSNVYFMNLVDEYDLLAFAENFPEDDKDGSKKKAEIASSEKKGDTIPSDKEDAASDNTPEDQPTAKPTVPGTSLLVPAVIILTLIGGAAFYFFRMKDSGKKSSKKHGFDDEDDFDDDETVDEDE